MIFTLPEQDYFTASELAARWNCLESDLLHLVETGKLPVADKYAAIRGKRRTVFLPNVPDVPPEFQESLAEIKRLFELHLGKEPEPSDSDLVVYVTVTTAMDYDKEAYLSAFEDAKFSRPDSMILVLLTQDVKDFEIEHSKIAFKDESILTPAAEQSEQEQPTTATTVEQQPEQATPSKEVRINITRHKLKTDLLDAPIEKAIKLAGSLNVATVFLQLKELAIKGELPFTGEIEGSALCYTNDNNETVKADGSSVKLTRDALRKRLDKRLKMESNGG